MTSFKMPSLGADMEKGILVSWHVQPGDQVKRGDIVAEVETEKGLMEVEIWNSGTITELCVHEGTEVPVGTVLATLECGEVTESAIPERRTLLEAVPLAQSKSVVCPELGGATTSIEAHTSSHGATPLARKMAAEAGLDLNTIQGSGPAGAVTKSDVEKALQPTRQAPNRSEITQQRAVIDQEGRERLQNMRAAMARQMELSKREIPHYYLKRDVDVAELMTALDLRNSARSVTDRILPIAAFMKATAIACKKVPEMNGFYTKQGFQPSQAIHVGLAISLKGGGLVAPAILNTFEKPIETLMQEILDLVARGRRGKLKTSEMASATITLTNLGDQGVDEVFGVINPPQVAIVGIGRISQRPCAREGLLGVHPVTTITLSGDHRVSDGHRGSLFLKHFAEALTQIASGIEFSDDPRREGEENGIYGNLQQGHASTETDCARV